MGEVWAATHLVTRRAVALKRLLHSPGARPDGQARARFVLEAQTACAVEHPNVVEILDFIESGAEPPVIVMELLQGETLESRLSREHTLALDETARVLLPVVSAVGTAHARGIVHRDLKPANIFLSRTGEREPVIKVLDFGIAKWLVPQAGEQGLRTQTGSTLGTPCYMAPEQAIGDRMVDYRVDIWSLGVIFYECLSGARPVEGENAAHMVMRLLSTGIIPIEQLVPTLPSDLAGLIGRMLAREPPQRPRDLREVYAALAPLANLTVPAFGEPRVAQVSSAEGTAAVTQASAPPMVWGATTPGASLDDGQLGAVRTNQGRSLAPWVGPRRWAALAAGLAASGVALGAARWFHAARPAPPAATLARPPSVMEDPALALAAPAPTVRAASGAPPAADPTPSATATTGPSRHREPLEPSRRAALAKPPSAPGPPSPAPEAPSVEPAKSAPAPSRPLDIQLLP